jgi:hypothetical protein
MNPVEIFINKHVVKRDLANDCVHDIIEIEVKKWNYDENTWNSIDADSVTMY